VIPSARQGFSAAGSTVGSHVITLSGLANPNYAVTFAPGTLTITARPITFKADNVTRTYGESTPAFSYSVSAGSMVAGDTFGTPNFSAAGSTVGSHAITLSGLTNPNYNITFAPGTLTVTARPITFTADDVTRTYGESTPAFAYSVSAGSIIAGDTFGAPNFNAAGSTVGSHAITLSGLANTNYDITFAPGTLTVTARPITFTADDVTRTYGESTPAFAYSVSAGSIIAGDTFGAPNFNAAGSTVGSHAITLSGLANTNYDITFAPGTLTVTARPITFTADDVTRTYGESTPAFAYSVSAGQHHRGRHVRRAELQRRGRHRRQPRDHAERPGQRQLRHHVRTRYADGDPRGRSPSRPTTSHASTVNDARLRVLGQHRQHRRW
jgi:mannose/fructose-specific phosphotransferase system component IIA